MKITIITVVYNGATTIADTLKSVASQTYPNIEHIVIDGGSTDETIEIVRQYRNGLTQVISEPDNGVYDAMNKGLLLATGDVIGMLNADDIYADKEVLSQVAEQFQDEMVDICYGDIEYVRRNHPDQVVRYWTSGSFKANLLRSSWYPPHSSFFTRSGMYRRLGGFNSDFPLAGDVELMFRFLKNARKVAYIPRVITRMRLGGISNARLTTVYRQNVAVRRAAIHNGLPSENVIAFATRKLLCRAAQFARRRDI